MLRLLSVQAIFEVKYLIGVFWQEQRASESVREQKASESVRLGWGHTPWQTLAGLAEFLPLSSHVTFVKFVGLSGPSILER